MTVSLESEGLPIILWRLLYQTYTRLKKCEDQICGGHGLTTEQFLVLATVAQLDKPVMITDIAEWLERSTNSISMIVDRMVKIGLVRRVRNKSDRRVVYVVITSKGENALRPAARTCVEFIQKIVSPLSYKDKHTLASLLKTLKYSMLEYLNPEVDAEQVGRRELKQQANLSKWALQHAVTSAPETERPGGEKRKTVRRR